MAPNSTRRAIAAAVLATGAKYQQAADEANVSLSTIKRWANEDEAFAADLDTAVVEHLGSFRDRLDAGIMVMLDRLDWLSEHAESEAVRLRACIDWLDRANVQLSPEQAQEDVHIVLNMNEIDS